MIGFQKVHTVTNPTLDGNGRFTETFGEFEKVVDAGIISMTGGYVGFVQGITGATVTVEVRQTAQLAHAGAAVADHAAAAIQGAVPINDHPVHTHDFIVAGGGAGAETFLTGANTFQASGAGGTLAGAGAVGVQNNAAVQTHAFGAGVDVTHNVTQPNAHTASVLAALGAGPIVAVIRILAEGI